VCVCVCVCVRERERERERESQRERDRDSERERVSERERDDLLGVDERRLRRRKKACSLFFFLSRAYRFGAPCWLDPSPASPPDAVQCSAYVCIRQHTSYVSIRHLSGEYEGVEVFETKGELGMLTYADVC
jgi:hypothetical protein